MTETFGSRLRKARNRLGWSQMELEIQSGVAQAAIGLYELDQRNPGFPKAVCLANTLGVSLDWLAGRTDRMEVCDAGNHD